LLKKICKINPNQKNDKIYQPIIKTMNIVARQGFKYSLIGYFGFFLGAFSAVFIYPFDIEFYGKLRYILPTAEILAPLVVFGLSYSTVKFFFQTKKNANHQNLLKFSLMGVVFNFISVFALFVIMSWVFPNFKQTQLWQMKTYILPLILFLALSQVFNKYISNFQRIVVPNIFENLFPKLANLVSFLLLFLLGFSQQIAFGVFLSFFFFALVGYFIYANSLEKIQYNFSTHFLKENNLWKSILSYSFYGFMGNVGNLIAIKIDGFMIGEYIGFQQNGIYSTLLSIVMLTTIPLTGINNISAPIINKQIAENQLDKLHAFYKKTSLTLFFLGLVLFACIFIGFPFLTQLMKNGEVFYENQSVLWVLGIAFLFDLATGFNGQIISMSKYYRFSIFVMFFLAINTILFNLYFIKFTQLGILGVAIATALSLTLFNLAKIIFIYLKLKISPFSLPMFYALVCVGFSVFLVKHLPNFSFPLINLAYKPLLIILLTAIGNYFLKIYPLDEFLNKTFLKSIFRF
jgi:O-antigen/teichoic acid export membrane protein